MHYAIAIWNFCEAETKLPLLVEEFADLGFDSVSFTPDQILGLDAAGERALEAVLEERSLAVTVHGGMNLSPDDAEALSESLGPRLLCLTFDPAMTSDSRGMFYDTSLMVEVLAEIADRTRENHLLYGIEDFPLDEIALEHYRADLAPILDAPRYGMLLDIGHMNIRRTRHDYFKGLSVEEYITRTPLPIVEVHVHDNSGDRDSHEPIGEGTVDFEAVAAGLKEAGFDGVSTIEVVPAFHGATIKESIPRAQETLETWRELME